MNRILEPLKTILLIVITILLVIDFIESSLEKRYFAFSPAPGVITVLDTQTGDTKTYDISGELHSSTIMKDSN